MYLCIYQECLTNRSDWFRDGVFLAAKVGCLGMMQCYQSYDRVCGRRALSQGWTETGMMDVAVKVGSVYNRVK